MLFMYTLREVFYNNNNTENAILQLTSYVAETLTKMMPRSRHVERSVRYYLLYITVFCIWMMKLNLQLTLTL